MSFKTELHCHCTVVSACGRITPAEIVDNYVKAGYTSLVITDHISRDTFQSGNYLGTPDWDAKVDFFLRSYRALQEAAKGRLNILLGAEVRIDSHHAADYLLYGVSEEFLRKVGCLHQFHLADLSRVARENGVLLVQAHPFRTEQGHAPADMRYVHGIEAYNPHPSFDSRITEAVRLATEHGKIMTSGSDFHVSGQAGGAGMIVSNDIADQFMLRDFLRTAAPVIFDRNGLIDLG